MLTGLFLAGLCGWVIGECTHPRGWLLPQPTLAKPYSCLIGLFCMIFNVAVVATGAEPFMKWSMATASRSWEAFWEWLFVSIVGTVIALWVFYGLERIVQHWWHNRHLGAING